MSEEHADFQVALQALAEEILSYVTEYTNKYHIYLFSHGSDTTQACIEPDVDGLLWGRIIWFRGGVNMVQWSVCSDTGVIVRPYRRPEARNLNMIRGHSKLRYHVRLCVRKVRESYYNSCYGMPAPKLKQREKD